MICSKCKIDKAEEEFSFRSISKNRRRGDCKECVKKRDNLCYQNDQKRRESIKDSRKLNRVEVRKKYIDYLLTCECCLCGENHPATLDFDHINPNQKTDTVSQMVRDARAWDVIWNEIQKCRVLCSNCHRKHTAITNNWLKITGW